MGWHERAGNGKRGEHGDDASSDGACASTHAAVHMPGSPAAECSPSVHELEERRHVDVHDRIGACNARASRRAVETGKLRVAHAGGLVHVEHVASRAESGHQEAANGGEGGEGGGGRLSGAAGRGTARRIGLMLAAAAHENCGYMLGTTSITTEHGGR